MGSTRVRIKLSPVHRPSFSQSSVRRFEVILSALLFVHVVVALPPAAAESYSVASRNSLIP